MSIPIRICFLYVSKMMDMLSNEELLLNFINRFWFEMRPELNITWIRQDSMGVLRDPETFQYDGCIGSVQRNESDYGTILTAEDYYGSSVRVWNTMFSDQNSIGTAYNKSHTTKTTTQVLDFLNAYSFEHWLATIYFMMAMYVIIMIRMIGRKKQVYSLRERIMKSMRDATAIALSCFLNQHGHCGTIRKLSITNWIYTLMTLLGFYTGFFLTSMIKTDMVVVHPPPTYQSYQDILDHDVIPTWALEANSFRAFQDAVPGSAEHRIWQRANERGINQSIISVNKIVDHFPDVALEYLTGVAHRTRVALGSGHITKLLAMNSCALIRSGGIMKEMNSFQSRDANAAEFLRVMLGSAFVRDDVRRQVSGKMNRKFEMSTFVSYIMQTCPYMLVSNEGSCG